MAKTTKTERPKMGDLIKQLPEQSTPIQEVRPVVVKAAEAEVKLNFFVPAELAKKIKVYAAENSTTIKDVSIAAYEQYFTQMNK
ncbi:hypothetical protein M0L20_28410 [Spirosoma sp. RP8]|uniref:CopG family transcriptional regulator n=1 Tax=Spirosoma liriopis TaxID=2937440 RepID=A0ABT0HUN6_9BACT|nr:hypothetical protein [Spirosoma liriopis]MCK8495822.1 hypothetical protein [Spirosoma liriopis]